MAACGGGRSSQQATPPVGVRVVSGVLYQKDPDGTRHVLSVFAPSKGGPWPVAVMIHGGTEGGPPELPLVRSWARAVAREGAVVFVPRWPGNPPEPSAKAALAYLTGTTGQLACAVRFARAEAKRYGGDPSNLSLFGHSAGASFASEIAFANPTVPAGCVARSAGSVVPDNLVLFEGDWLIVSDPVFDGLLQQDPRVMAAITPWSYLKAAARIPVHILDSNDPNLVVSIPQDVARWLALRDPTGTLRSDLERHGAFADGQLSMHEAQRLLYRRLQSLGYPATFLVLPGSSHSYLSKAALQALAKTILQRR
jgi:acetyl esterase/lipase